MARVTINIDADLSNADWTKGTWDLTGIDSVEKLRDMLAQRGESVAAFKKRPVYRMNLKKQPWLKEL